MSEIQAAGGVVWRRSDRSIEIALVHRPRYDDWSLPKGKLDRGETQLLAAVREIDEEIGAKVHVQRYLGEITYRTSTRAQKSVAYWSMRYVGGAFVPSAEVDELAWVPVSAARRLLSYDIDHDVLDAFEHGEVPDSVVVLVRHARAGKRAAWQGEDDLRPLDAVGRAQARRLAALLPAFGVSAVSSADLVRCEQTVTPLAQALGTTVRRDHVYSDDACAEDPKTTVAAIAAASDDAPARGAHRPVGDPADTPISAVCSQGITIPTVIAELFDGDLDTRTRKAAFWVLGFAAGSPISADYYEDALHPPR